MKQLSLILVSLFSYILVSAQSVTLRFDGANNPNAANVRHFAVDIDGKTYYSANAEAVGTTAATQLVLDQLSPGTHELAVHRINSNATVSSTKGTAVYTNSFRLRQGYDMLISIKRNGQVTFSEKRITGNSATAGTSKKTALNDTEFDKLLQSVKAKWSQTARYTSIKTSISNKANYFTTHQLGELLMTITSEAKRLELAKAGYVKVTDQENFADTRDLFDSQANKDNIDKFILSKNPQTVVGATTETYYGRQPMATSKFNQLMTTVRNQYQQTGKYAVIRDAFNVTDNYFTTSQVRQLLTLITSETDRLSLAKMSYAHVSDPTNFTSLNYLFTTQANRDELSNYVKYGETTTSTPSADYSNRTAMSDGDFSKLQLKARLHFRQSSTVEDVREALLNKDNYFTIEQIRSLLTLIAAESDRLALAKLAYHRSTDPAKISTLNDLFSTQASIDELNNYLRTNKS